MKYRPPFGSSVKQKKRSVSPYSALEEILPNYLNVGNSFDEYDSPVTINQHKKNKAKKITDVFREIKDHEGSLFRFYDETLNGLSSLAQKKGQEYLPTKAKEVFVNGHMHANEKAIKSNQTGNTYYSPFVSTTSSLRDFLNTSFSSGGDMNIRNDVFQRSPYIGRFDNISPKYIKAAAPSKRIDKSQGDKLTAPNLPHKEREVVFDTSDNNYLKDYLTEIYDNPLLGKLQPDLIPLAISRKKLVEPIKNDISRYATGIKAIPTDKSLNDEQIEAFRNLRSQGKMIEGILANIQVPIPATKGYDLDDEQPKVAPIKNTFSRSQINKNKTKPNLRLKPRPTKYGAGEEEYKAPGEGGFARGGRVLNRHSMFFDLMQELLNRK